MKSKIKKAYLIDAEKREITQVEVGDYTTYYPLLKCEVFTTVGLEDDDTLYVDDEGLFQPQENFFMYQGYNQPLAGNGLVLGTDKEGNSVDPKMTLETLKSKVKFMNRKEVYQWVQENT